MAGWSKPKDILALTSYETNCEGHKMPGDNLGFTVKDRIFHDCKDDLESLFDQVIPIFLREISVDNCARPLPAMLSNGQPVNLFQLFCVVKRNGGFCNVSENGMWGLVAEGCGFSPVLMSSIELVYIKYLNELDGWLRKIKMDARMDNGETQIIKKLGLLIEESKELKGLVCSDEDKGRNTGKVELDFDSTGKPTDIYGGKHGPQQSDDSMNLNKVNHAVESSYDNEKDIIIQHDKSITFSAKSFVENIINSQKKKLCSEAKVEKVQVKVEASRSFVDNRTIGVRDDYDILLSARSVVNKVISSMKSELGPSRPSQEVANVRKTNDYDRYFSPKRIVDKDVDSRNKVNSLLPWKGINVVHGNVGNTKADCGKVRIPDNARVGNPVVFRKRKREHISLPGMLKWMAHVAKHSNDPAIGEVPGPSTWKSHGTQEYWRQALLAREALFVKRPIYADLVESSFQKKQKMHPSMYEDTDVIHKSAERVQRSKSFLLSKSQFSPHWNRDDATPRNLASPGQVETDNARKVPSSPMSEGILSRFALAVSGEEAPVSDVSVGLSFQAEIPEWTGVASEYDSKWLGTKMWVPDKDENNKTPTEKHRIGKGRQSTCDCLAPGSSTCIGFHIAEKKLELKVALGPLFYRWKFNRMGEEVSLGWTREEQKRFKAMVLQNSTGHNHFWNNAFKLFPSKTREDLVSYYFNVFVLRCRSYQNRVTPDSIDSDDDETDLGPIGRSSYFAGNLAPVTYFT
ncbi:hypothetical protein DCAR_0100405 [Daucus carota subsp. sativus]|uniref:Uncharacterized protein n=1 Tax=Daucus carota subsp. sativus TaxID=79200 RepID=A0A161ZKR0_DAUCS|nr:PREDICTED: AT-rich interactive domain-containing protein 2-like [Daucus carota subsp. sativus]XP_017219529.1 PREDICTED: AT-rich interactive domain-containing protein 2-like [Daucus carota subsp. sativus]XP_017219538.1 PREDICTED: AT-rich interactive domain-containing protein 2-like [Daucus carota subsp. sativus]WOG81260.1 hypothetical protein DCAR_0100405 [Daucus carota subsp. sativus]